MKGPFIVLGGHIKKLLKMDSNTFDTKDLKYD